MLRPLAGQLGIPARPRRSRPTTSTPSCVPARLRSRSPRTTRAAPRTAREGARSASSSPIRSTSPALDDLRLLFAAARCETELVPRRAHPARHQPGLRPRRRLDRRHRRGRLRRFRALASEISAEPQDLLDADDDAPIIRLVNSLLQQAVKERASDIHIEPFEKEIRVRFRIDDVLYEPIAPCRSRCSRASSSRIKIMAASTSRRSACPRTAASA